jgi:hypothetical protein
MTAATAYCEPIPAGWSEGLDPAAVLAGQGIDASGRAARLPALQAAAARALAEGMPLLAPAVATRVVLVERASLVEVVLAGGETFRGEAVARRLSGSLQVLLAVCTVGDACDRRARVLMREDPAAALAFDGLATAAVNALAAALCRDVRKDAGHSGQRTTPPLGPGEGEWELADGQHLIFALVKPARIAVKLSEGGQMQPCKSVSFVVGIGPTVNDRGPGGCAGCSAKPGCHWSKLRKDW